MDTFKVINMASIFTLNYVNDVMNLVIWTKFTNNFEILD